jgi:signal peptidase II
MISRIARYKWLLALASAIFIGDQVTKAWIVATLSYPTYHPAEGAIVVIPEFFHIVHLRNSGAAWGIFEGMSLVLGFLALIALAAIFYFRRHLHLDLPAVQISFGLLCGGILGNLLDRMVHGSVIDFLDFHLGFYTWPAFNVADMGIVTGVMIYLTLSFVKPSAIERKEN